jgi:hypothetical protein
VQEEKMLPKIEELLYLKATVNETYLHPKEIELEAYISKILNYCESYTSAFVKHQGDTNQLNQFFREIINQPWP